MPKEITLLVDESGDQGLDRVMTHENPFGASSYLTMGGVLLPTKNLSRLRTTIENIRKKLCVKQLHCTDMSHQQVSYFASQMASQRILAFGVVSKKSTLGNYKDQIEGDDQAHDYYNKCSQYLLELVAKYAGTHGLSAKNIDIIFEEKRGHDYSRLGRYLKAIADNPIDKRAAVLQHLSPFQISAKTKNDEPLVAIADLVAYSLHKSFCSENNRLKLTEQRYLRELKSKFCKCEKTSRIANFGIKFIKGPVEMGLSGRDRAFAMKFY